MQPSSSIKLVLISMALIMLVGTSLQQGEKECSKAGVFCKECSSEGCQKCYGKITANNMCDKKPTVEHCAEAMSENTCTMCYMGYFVSSSGSSVMCKKNSEASPQIENCEVYKDNASGCNFCKKEYHFDGTKCVAVPDGDKTTACTYYKPDKSCRCCKDGYGLMPDGKCSSDCPKGCMKCDANNKCTQCDFMHYYFQVKADITAEGACEKREDAAKKSGDMDSKSSKILTIVFGFIAFLALF